MIKNRGSKTKKGKKPAEEEEDNTPDVDDNDYKKVSYHDVKAYEGRAIGLKKESDIIYCWASGYRQGDKDSLIDYPSIIEIVT